VWLVGHSHGAQAMGGGGGHLSGCLVATTFPSIYPFSNFYYFFN
jgi:hypothetical protein